jgi:LmbE family N-acetylglucosaminyl deacetylase
MMLTVSLGGDGRGPERILCLGAHADDIEIGCSGTLFRILEQHTAVSVTWVVLGCDERRAQEALESAHTVLAQAGRKTVSSSPFATGLPSEAARIKECFEELKSDLSPDVVFTHYRHDLHQDHRLMAELTWNTFRDHLILEYEIPKYDGDMGNPNVFVHLDQALCQRKVANILTSFRSQAGKRWFTEDLFLAVLRLRGMSATRRAGTPRRSTVLGGPPDDTGRPDLGRRGADDIMNPVLWRNKRVLITGHTGFKGSWLGLWLGSVCARVAGYALEPPTEPNLYRLARLHDVVESTRGDVRDLDNLLRTVDAFEPEIVFHMAAQSVVLRAYEDPVGTYSTNVLGTVHLLEAIRRLRGACTVVNVTTDKCYANKGWVWGYRENADLGEAGPYSSSKACAELVGQAYRGALLFLRRARPTCCRDRERSRRQRDWWCDWTPHQLIPDTVSALTRGEPVMLRHRRQSGRGSTSWTVSRATSAGSAGR